MAKTRKAVKMADIAQRLQVSTVTVSKALSGQKGVSEEMRARIRELAEQMGYQPPGALREKQQKKSYNIGVLISDRYLADYESFYWKLYQEVADEAIRRKFFILFEILTEDQQKNRLLPRLLVEKKVEGLIVIGKPGYEYSEYLRTSGGLPLVFLDFYEQDPSVDCFISDGFHGTYLLTNYLISRGHRDIAYVGTLFSTESITDRYLGYVKSLLEHGITPNPDYLIKDRDEKSGRRDDYSNFAFPAKMPTAFVCNCDFIASLVIKALEERGLKVPEDISVVGYDNYLYPGLSDVEITTYAVDIREMARGAVNTLFRKLAGENYKKGIHIVEGHFVEKKSVAECKRS